MKDNSKYQDACDILLNPPVLPVRIVCIMRLGTIIKGWRDSQRLGIRAVAEEIGISHGTLSRIERGEACDGQTLIKVILWLLS